MLERYDVLIVGGGHGGAQAAIWLRQRKFVGSIAVVGEESDLPYERPALSKEYLSGERAFERLLIRPAAFWSERNIAMLGGRKVISIDASNYTVGLADSSTLGYRTLIWAAGGHARRLTCSGHDLEGVHTIRNRVDVDRLVVELKSTDRVAVIGAGYIGLEAAAVLCKLGKKVSVFETLGRVLARVAGEPLSRFYEAQHRAHGVNILLDTKVACIEGKDGHATGVRLLGGELVAARAVIVGIGIQPAVGPLQSAGAQGSNGVAVDEYCRTSLPDIYAIGDCALHSSRYAEGQSIRLESVQNATDMAATVAKALTGTPEPYRAVPWFWSNQYDLRLQTVGLSTGYDDCIVRGQASTRSFSIIYRRAGRVIALDCVNATKDYVQGKALVLSGVEADTDTLADVTVPLKRLTERTGALGEALSR